MKLYITATGRYAGTQADAKADGKGWTLEEVPTDKPGLIAYLNALRSTPPKLTVHGAVVEPFVPTLEQALASAPPVLKPGYAEQSIQLDTDFDNLPLARQLDLAARAMENARDSL